MASIAFLVPMYLAWGGHGAARLRSLGWGLQLSSPDSFGMKRQGDNAALNDRSFLSSMLPLRGRKQDRIPRLTRHRRTQAGHWLQLVAAESANRDRLKIFRSEEHTSELQSLR